MKNIGKLIWNVIEDILKCLTFKILHLKMTAERWEQLMQFAKFALVGLSNVFVSYGIYLLFFLIFQTIEILPNTDYLFAQIIGYVLSILWSFYWNRKYVFRAAENTISWKTALIKSFVSYSFAGIFLNSILSYVWVELIRIPKIVSPIINLIINVPVNFLLNKLWAFKKR